MSFSFSYVYEASDKFTPVAKKIAKTVKALNKELEETSKLMKATNTSTKALQGRLKKTFDEANPKILKTRQEMKRVATETTKTTKAVKELHEVARKKIKGSVDITQKVRGGATASGATLGAGGAAAKTANKKAGGLKPMIGGGIAQAAGAVVMLGGLSKMGEVFSTYEENLTSIRRVMNPTADEMQFLKDRSLELGKTFAISTNRILDSYKTVAQFTGDLPIDQLDMMTEAAVTLSKAGEVSVEQAATSMAASLAQFGKDANSATKFLDIMAEASVAGSSEIRDTAEALAVAGSVASFTGLSFEETNAGLQALAKSNIIGRRAGTGFAGVMMNLQKHFFNGKNILKDGLLPVLDELAKKQGDAAYLTDIFGKEHAKSGLALIQHRGFVQDLTGSLGAEGAAMKLAMEGADNLGTSWDRLGVILESKVIQTMERLAPALKPLLDDFGVWMDSINVDTINGIADSFAGLAWSISKVAQAMAIVTTFTQMQGDKIGQGMAWIFNPELHNMGEGFSDSKQKSLDSQLGRQMNNFTGADLFDVPSKGSSNKGEVTVKVEAVEGSKASVSTSGSGISLDTGANVGEEG